MQLIVGTVGTWSLEPHEFDLLLARFHVLMATDAAAGVSVAAQVLLFFGAFIADLSSSVLFEDGRSAAGTNAAGMWDAVRVQRLNDLLYKSSEANITAGFANFDPSGVLGWVAKTERETRYYCISRPFF